MPHGGCCGERAREDMLQVLHQKISASTCSKYRVSASRRNLSEFLLKQVLKPRDLDHINSQRHPHKIFGIKKITFRPWYRSQRRPYQLTQDLLPIKDLHPQIFLGGFWETFYILSRTGHHLFIQKNINSVPGIIEISAMLQVWSFCTALILDLALVARQG